jgi:hypothetical protein
MNVTNPNDEDDDEQSTTEQTDGGQPTQGPPAASKRDVEEAERKADDARERARMLEGECDGLRARNEKLREEIEELRELHATHAIALEYVFANAAAGMWGATLPNYEVPAPLKEPVAKLKEQAGEEGRPVEAE